MEEAGMVTEDGHDRKLLKSPEMRQDVGLDVAGKPRSPNAPLLPSLKNKVASSRRCIVIVVVVLAMVLIIGLSVGLSRSRQSNTPVEIPSHSFRIVSYNDVYEISARTPSSSDPLLLRGGAAFVSGYVKAVRAAEPHTLVVLAGDTLSPSLMSQFFNGTQMIHAHNAIGLDYACLGNHEFDLGVEVLRERLQESNFKWLNANVYEADNATLFADTVPNALIDYGFVKVGIFGLLYQVSYVPVTEAVIRDPLAAAKQQIAELKAKGATFVIALTHQPFAESCQVAGLPGMSLVLTGHDHAMQAGSCGVPTVVATSDWADIWDLKVDYGRPGGKLANSSNPSQAPLITLHNVPVSNQEISIDPAVATLVQNYENQLNTHVKEVIGSTTVPLDVTASSVRQKESAVADFVTDYLRLQWRPFGVALGAALLNGGGFRSNLIYPPGNLTVADIITIFPFSNVLPVVWLTGKELWLGLEECFAKAEFPQVSGINYIVDFTQPAGSRVLNVTWAQGNGNFTANATVADNDYFLFVTNDFMLNLISAWVEARTNVSRIVIEEDEAPLLSDTAIQAVRQSSPIAPVLDGRIVRLG